MPVHRRHVLLVRHSREALVRAAVHVFPNPSACRGLTRQPAVSFDSLEPRTLLSAVTFGAPTPYGQDSSLGVVLADMNGDGKLDVLAPESALGGSTVDVYLNLGNGTFGTPTKVTASSASMGVDQPYAVAAADLNNDGKMDIITASFSGQLSVMLGDGSGTNFSAATVYATGSESDGVAVGDLNGDHIPDIVVANRGSNSVDVFTGKGDGTFNAPVSYATGMLPNSATLADLNGDGLLDIITANAGDNTVSVLLNSGGGTFAAANDLSMPGSPVFALAGDFNGDGKADIASANVSGGTVGVLLGDGSGTAFAAPTTTAVGTSPFMLAAADFNGDGHLDLAVAEQGASTVGVLIGNGDGTFQPDIESPAGLPAASISSGDINGDGKIDLVAGSYDPSNQSSAFTTLVNGGSTASIPAGVDSTFGATTGGSVSLPFTVEQVVQTPLGQILSVGHQGSIANSTSQGVLEQLNADGSLNQSFGGGANVTTPMSANDAFYSAAITPLGQIVAVGASNGSFLVARYNSNGTLDTSFANSGFATVSFASDGAALAASVAVQPNGSIVVAGEAGGLFAVARLTAAGTLDSSFNPAGAADPTFPGGGERIVAAGSGGTISQVLIQPDGKILGVGAAGSAVIVFRLNTSGSNDATFGTGGIDPITQIFAADPNGNSITPGIGLQPGGAILVAGEAASPGGFAAVRLDPVGVVDTIVFGTSGIAAASFGGTNDDLSAIQVNPTDGEFVLIGTTNAGGTIQAAVAAFNADGTPNTTALPPNGQVILTAASATSTTSLISAGGRASNSARLNAFHPQIAEFAFATFQSDGKVLVGSTAAGASRITRLQTLASAQTKIGDFGKIGRKLVKLPAFTLANGTTVSISLVGGSGTAYRDGNQKSLTLSGNVAVTFRTAGGVNAFGLSNVTETGNLRLFTAPTATVNGTLSSSGSIGILTLAGVSGVVRSAGAITSLKANTLSGSVSCGGALAVAKVGTLTGILAATQIRNLTVGNLTDATLLAGTDLGAGGQLSSDGTNTYGVGQITSLRVTGIITASVIGAGVNPQDGIFGDGDDSLAGPKSLIRALSVKGGIDAATKFEAGGFPKIVRVPGKVITATDMRFIMLH